MVQNQNKKSIKSQWQESILIYTARGVGKADKTERHE